MNSPSRRLLPAAVLLLVSGTCASCDPEDKSLLPPGPHSEDTREPSALQDSVGDDEVTATDAACRTRKVDLLFVIDNSGSMSQEQAKLARTVPELLGILATGNRNGKRSMAGEPTDFAPAESIHVGVISTDLAVNLAPAVNSCGERSFVAWEHDTRTSVHRVNKPFGDDGKLLASTEVAVAGISVPFFGSGEPVTVVPPDPGCANISLEQPYLTYEPGDRFEDTGAAFACISKLGKNGCGFEQQLEAMLKALTPANDTSITFSRNSHGQGTAPGSNAGFLREDAVLTIVHVSDEDDCSIPDASSALFDQTSMVYPGGVNVRCLLPENQQHLHAVDRYVEGLRALKPAPYRDRIIFASVSGAPLAENSGSAVNSGEEGLTELLGRPDMQPHIGRNAANTDDEALPACVSPSGDGSAWPGRRFIETAARFGEDGLVSSICDDSYLPLVGAVSERIARHLGDCD